MQTSKIIQGICLVRFDELVFDILGESLIESKDLIEQIDKYGVEIYSNEHLNQGVFELEGLDD